MKKSIHLALVLAVASALLCATSVAQEPVLFDGTNPVAFSFQGAPSDETIPQAQLITPEQLAKDASGRGT